MSQQLNLRYNAEVERTGEDPSTQNYITYSAAATLLRSLREGDAAVFNAVAGPGADEI
jgi:hypothetical protein